MSSSSLASAWSFWSEARHRSVPPGASLSHENEEGRHPLPAPQNEANSETSLSAAELRAVADLEASVDLQAFALYLRGLGPYLTMLGGILVCSFFNDLSGLLWLTSSIYEVNRSLRQALAKKKELQVVVAVKLTAFVVLTTGCQLLLTDFSWFWRTLALLPPLTRPTTVATTLFRVALADTFVRLMATLPKLALLLACKSAGLMASSKPKASPAAAARAQGRLLTLAEHALLLYRTALPVQSWCSYLLHSSSPILSSLLVGLYLVLKYSDLQQALTLLVRAARIAMRRGATYGTYVSAPASAPHHAPGPDSGSTASSGPSHALPGTGFNGEAGAQGHQHSRRRDALSPPLPGLSARHQQALPGAAEEGPGEAGAAGVVDLEAGFEDSSGATCPVCHDTPRDAVRLDCLHVFCEDCICEWLERHHTCPMCRAQCRPAGVVSCADGATSLLPQLF